MEQFKLNEIFVTGPHARDIYRNKIGGLEVQILSNYDDTSVLAIVRPTAKIIRLYGQIEDTKKEDEKLLCTKCKEKHYNVTKHIIKKRILGMTYAISKLFLCEQCLHSTKYK
jgi:hypothetical protein